MTDRPTESMSICEILGCSGEATTTRWVITEDQGKRELRVCSKHADGDIAPEMVPTGV